MSARGGNASDDDGNRFAPTGTPLGATPESRREEAGEEPDQADARKTDEELTAP
jgi:hypothetical protein